MKVRGAKKKRKKTHLLQNQFAQCWYLKNVSTTISLVSLDTPSPSKYQKQQIMCSS